LREGVKFHDGAPWNCQAAKMNFDHVLCRCTQGASMAWLVRCAQIHQEMAMFGWWYGTHFDNEDQVLPLSTRADIYPSSSILITKCIRRGSNIWSIHRQFLWTWMGYSWKWSRHDPSSGSLWDDISGTGPFAFASREESIQTTADFDELRVDDEVVSVFTWKLILDPPFGWTICLSLACLLCFAAWYPVSFLVARPVREAYLVILAAVMISPV
jgi:hypothetical protein